MSEDEWRVEVDLDDEEQGYPFDERIRSLRIDDEARERLGGQVAVTRDGPRLFLYTAAGASAQEAEAVIRALMADHDLSGTVCVTRWHPIEEEWKDAALPLPRTPTEEQVERARHEEAEWRDAAAAGEFDWLVKAALPHRSDAIGLAAELSSEGLDVRRRWRYLTVGALTEESANTLGVHLRERAPAGTEVWVAVNPDGLERSAFRFFPPLT
jgi:hypothetical protein